MPLNLLKKTTQVLTFSVGYFGSLWLAFCPYTETKSKITASNLQKLKVESKQREKHEE